jgi:hypothetical protein
MNFEILRNMESFTKDMFNRIISFQEKEHAAWNTTLSFEERITGLPLHYLIFSNADRDPATHGPTVAHYYPLRKEMQSIARYAKAASDTPVIIDAHGRNGFIGSLVAREAECDVLGLTDADEKPNQIEKFASENYHQKVQSLADYRGPVDLLLSSWMPSNTDISADVKRLQPTVVVYIYSEHTNPDTGEWQTGKENAFGEQLGDDYQLIDEWQVIRQKDLLHEIWPDLTGNIAETRFTRVYAKVDSGIDQHELEDTDPSYDWEDELIMTETAMAAKQEMVRRGFPPENLIT